MRSFNTPVLGDEEVGSKSGKSSTTRGFILLPREASLGEGSMISVGCRERLGLVEDAAAGGGDGGLRALATEELRILETDKGGVDIGGEGFGIYESGPGTGDRRDAPIPGVGMGSEVFELEVG